MHFANSCYFLNKPPSWFIKLQKKKNCIKYAHLTKMSSEKQTLCMWSSRPLITKYLSARCHIRTCVASTMGKITSVSHCNFIWEKKVYDKRTLNFNNSILIQPYQKPVYFTDTQNASSNWNHYQQKHELTPETKAYCSVMHPRSPARKSGNFIVVSTSPSS
jgi:hypothetical protein